MGDGKVVTSLELKNLLAKKELNPRTSLGDIETLKDSVKKHGIIQPLVVREGASGKYVVVCGYRRHAVAVALKLKTLPVIVRKIKDDLDALAVAMSENSTDSRTALTTIDEANAYKKFLNKGMSANDVGKSCGVSGQKVRNTVALLDAPKDIQSRLQNDTMTKEAAIQFTRLTPEIQKKILPGISDLEKEHRKEETRISHDEVRMLADLASKELTKKTGAPVRPLKNVKNERAGKPVRDMISVWRTRTVVKTKMEDTVADIFNLEQEKPDKVQIGLRHALAGMLFCAGEVDDFNIESKPFRAAFKHLESLLVEEGADKGKEA